MAMVPKGQSKTTYSGGMIVTAMLMNVRPLAENVVYRSHPGDFGSRLHPGGRDDKPGPRSSASIDVKFHLKEIHDKKNGSKMKVKTFSLDILTGSMPVFVLLDELWLLGRNTHAAKVIRQIRGGIEKNSEGFFMIITTQSDEPPAGVFRDELITARKSATASSKAKHFRAMLALLYEFPEHIAKDANLWQNPECWHLSCRTSAARCGSTA